MGYFAEFWDSIVSTIVGGTTYTVEFFENIGNAVAGALVMSLLQIAHPFVDIVLGVQYIFSGLFVLLTNLFVLPLFLYNFIISFIQDFGNYSSSLSWSSNITGVLSVIPFWPVISAFISILLLISILFFVFKVIRSS